MKIDINDKTRIIILWPIILHRWNDIIEYIEQEITIKIKNKLVVFPEKIDDQNWFEFVLKMYMSHVAVDGLDTKENLKRKIDKKIRSEFFGLLPPNNRRILILLYDVNDDHRDKIIQKVKSVCRHDDTRIANNLKNCLSRDHCYDQNEVKDIIRHLYKDDEKLPSHSRGRHYGRKRIAHCPESPRGAAAIVDFVFEEGAIISEYSQY